MDREVCGVCGAWKGDDELIALRQDLAAARALLLKTHDGLKDALRYTPNERVAIIDLLRDRIDAALAGEKNNGA